MRRRSFLVCLMLLACSPAIVRAQGAAPRPSATGAAVHRGLDWLAQQQKEDGGFASGAGAAAAERSGYSNEVAVTALSGLAFLAAGSEPDKGDYSKPLRAALNYVLANQAESGLLAAPNTQGPMYGHGYATLFLAETYMRSRDPAIAKALDKAVELLNHAQSKEGGWRYLPRPTDADVSVTACALNALLAARAAGIATDARVIKDAVDYVDRCQNKDGGFSYMAGQGEQGSSGLPRSAAAVAVMIHGGARPDDADVRRGINYVVAKLTAAAAAGPAQQPGAVHYWYGVYYASQWLPFAGDDARNAYQRAVDDIAARQQANGSWTGDFSPEYATATALIVLQAPDRRLWIYK